MKRVLSFLFVLLLAVPVFAAGTVKFADGKFPDGKVSAKMNAGEFTELYARANFGKKLSSIPFDKMQITLENVGGAGIFVTASYNKGSIGERWMKSDYMDFDLIDADGKSEFKDVNDYKDLSMDDLTGKPKRIGVKAQDVMLTVAVYKITGYSRKMVWDDFDNAWVEKKTPILSGGTVIAKGKLTIVQKASAVANGFQSKDDSFAIPYSTLIPKVYDETGYSTPINVSGFKGSKDADTTYPAPYLFGGFSAETAKLPEPLRTMAGLKESINGSNARNEMGWSYFVDGLRNMENQAPSVDYSPVTIGGFTGERAIVLGPRGFAVIYILQTQAYTYCYWFSLGYIPYSLYNTDIKNIVWSEKFTDANRQAYLGAWDSIMGSVKILK